MEDDIKRIKTIGVEPVFHEKILSADSGHTCARLMQLQMSSGHILHYGEGQVVCLDYQPADESPQFVTKALERLKEVVAVIHACLGESIDESIPAADMTLDQCFRCFNLRRWGDAWETNKHSYDIWLRRISGARDVPVAFELFKVVGGIAF